MIKPLHTPRVKSARTACKLFLTLCTIFILSSQFLHAQSPGPFICTPNAGPDQSICTPNCATLTGTYAQVNAPTSYTTATIPYSPYSYTVGTAVTLSDDAWSGVIPMGFNFCFYGNTYNQIVIGSNGILTFDVAQAGGYCQWPIN